MADSPPLRPRLRRQRLLVSFGVLAVLFLGYTAAGFLVAPSLLRSQLIERAARAGLELHIGALRTNPFSLAVEASDVSLSTAKNERIATLEHAKLDLAWSSAWRKAWTLQRVDLDRPVLQGLPAAKTSRSAEALPLVEVSELHVARGKLALPGLPALEAIELSASGLSTAQDAEARVQGSARLSGGGDARTQGTLSLSPLELSGKLELRNAALAHAWRYLPARAGTPLAGSISASFDYRYGKGRLALSNANAEARLAKGGSLSARGALETQPFRADLRLAAAELPLELAGRFLPASLPARIAAGTASGAGRLQIGAANRFDGAIAIAGGRIDDEAGTPLLGWERLETKTLRVDFGPFAAHADEVSAKAPHGTLVIGPHGELNLAALAPAKASTANAAKAPSVSIDRLSIEQGELDFADRSLGQPFATIVRDLSGIIDGLGTDRPEPARVQLSGRVGKYGDARVRGTIDLDAPATRTNINLRFRNLALADFTPYAAKFAGYRIRSGRLTANLHYRVRDGRLVGDNQLVFNKLELGDKVESASALDLPLELAVALLTDSKGNIDLAIPVSGNLNDPQIDLGGLIAQAVRNTLGRIVSAPFRMLASLLGRSDAGDLEAVSFDPGSSVLAPPEEEDLAQVANALKARPQLALVVRGGYDPEADAQALRREAVSRELARLSGYGASDTDLRDPRTLQVAEKLYEQKGAPAGELKALKSAGPGYGRRLMDALATKVELGPDAIQALGRARAVAIRNALVQAGIAADRVRIEAPAERKGDESGIAASLELRPR